MCHQNLIWHIWAIKKTFTKSHKWLSFFILLFIVVLFLVLIISCLVRHFKYMYVQGIPRETLLLIFRFKLATTALIETKISRKYSGAEYCWSLILKIINTTRMFWELNYLCYLLENTLFPPNLNFCAFSVSHRYLFIPATFAF